MTPQDEQMIRQASIFTDDPLPVVLFTQGKGRADEKMAQFCSRMKELVPGLKIKKDNDLPIAPPALTVGRHQNIIYQALPTGKFLTYFLEALENKAAKTPESDPKVDERLEKIDLPVNLRLYVAAQCPHCPQSIRQLQTLAAQSPFFRLQIIDAEFASDRADTDQIRSVPTLILDDKLRWTGFVNTDELLSLCIQRDPSQLSSGSLRQLIEDGDAARVASMMVAAGQFFPALVELLVHERWSVRLGAMVAAEYLADEAPSLSLALCESLWERFDRLIAQVQGDVIQVLGQVDSPKIRNYLQSVISGDYDDEVKATASEVLEEMGDLPA